MFITLFYMRPRYFVDTPSLHPSASNQCGSMCAIKSHEFRINYDSARALKWNTKKYLIIVNMPNTADGYFYPASTTICTTRDVTKKKYGKMVGIRSKEKLFNEHAFARATKWWSEYERVDCLWRSIKTGCLFAVSIFGVYRRRRNRDGLIMSRSNGAKKDIDKRRCGKANVVANSNHKFNFDESNNYALMCGKSNDKQLQNIIFVPVSIPNYDGTTYRVCELMPTALCRP